MLDPIARVNLDYMVHLAGHPDWAAEQTKAVDAYNLEHGALFGDAPIPTFPKPLFISPRQAALLEDAASRVLSALDRFVDLWLERPELQELWNVSDEELDLYKIDPGYAGTVHVARFDGFLSEYDLKFLEFNCDSPGGPGYGDVMQTAARRHLLEGTELADRYAFRDVPHLPALAEALRAPYASWRRRTDAGRDRPETPFLVVADWADVGSRPDIDIAVEALDAADGGTAFDAVFADPRDLELDGDELVLDGRRVDMVYKRVIVKELVENPDAGALAEAYRAGTVCMVNPPRSMIVGNKKMLAALRRPDVWEHLSPGQRDAVDRYVPWTEVLRDAKVRVQGIRVELRDLVLDNRERLVLKAAQGYGGKQVHLGRDTDPEEWAALVDDHLHDNAWIVQQYVPVPRELFPVVSEDGRVELKTLYVNINPFVFGGRFAGAYTRVSKSRVVNVSAGGGLVPTYVVEPKTAGEAGAGPDRRRHAIPDGARFGGPGRAWGPEDDRRAGVEEVEEE